MDTQNNTPKTLLEAVRYFSDLDVCHRYMISIRWPDGQITCPMCGCNRIGNIASRRMLQCKDKDCRKQFSTKVGTVFEDSPLGLDKWFVAVWCITNAKNGISSHELGRAIGVSQRAAWHMLHRIRAAMKAKTFKTIEGTVESDETFIGGKAKNMHANVRREKINGRGTVGKVVVHGILERAMNPNGTSRVTASVVPNQKAKTLQPRIRDRVASGSRVFTDSLSSYEGLSDVYAHDTVEHAAGQYVKDSDVHTNCMENFWTLLKRSLKGTYVSVEPEHLESYCDEQVFRFNERYRNDAGRFELAMKSVIGVQLTWKDLVDGNR